MGVVVDTSALILIERRGGDVAELAAIAARENARIASITISELLVGAHRAAHSAQRLHRESFVAALLDFMTVEPFDEPIARVHAALVAELSSRGQLIGPYDMLIAATAIALNYAVLTHNARDFERVPGLVVRQPNW